MKRSFAALVLALMMGCAVGSMAAAQEIAVYVSPGTVDEGTAHALVQLLGQAMPQADFVQTDEGTGTLWEQVLSGTAPQIAICTAQEAARYAKEGLLLPLDMDAQRAERIARAVLNACTYGGKPVMIPLYARHRRVAVNRKLVEEMQLGALLDARSNPVWQPMQLYQVLEEAALGGSCAMEIWPCGGEDGAAVLAFVQALYGGVIMASDGENAEIDGNAVVMAVEWLCDMVDSELVGIAESREEALHNFLAGKTALFIDWTDEEAQAYAAGIQDKGKYMIMPLPSSLGIPVRDAQVVGAAVFSSGDEELDALAARAAKLLAQDEQAQRLLGEQGIDEDAALWLACPDVGGTYSVLRGMMGAALDAVLAGDIEAEAAMYLLQAACEGGR